MKGNDMETVREQALRLYELHQQRAKLTAAFAEADRVYFAGAGDAETMKARTEAGDALNQAIAAGAELRRLAARHPGYFRDGWRETPDMIPEPLTDDERLNRLQQRSEKAKQEQAEREQARQAERQARQAADKKRADEIKEERRQAAAAAGQIKNDEPGKNQSAGRKK